jgi:acetylornithine deacetylase/succinyl-diaminopimelate desuccinylase-like protein
MRPDKVSVALIFIVLVCCLPHSSAAQTSVRAYRQSHEVDILKEFVDLLVIPNVATDLQNIGRNARHIASLLERRGVRTRLLETSQAPPVVYGELIVAGATRTLIFYAHYDGQPVEPAKWATGDPFKPAIFSAAQEAGGQPIAFPKPGERVDPEWRVYARSASDDKAPIVAILRALDALRASNTPLTSNFKFFFEGEEEAGSPHLSETVARHKDLLSGDAWIICDGPVNQDRSQQVYFGVRGVTGFELTVYGSKRELHSGHYGNWAPNPAMMLARLLTSMKADDGRVLVEGFYEGIEPLSETEKRALSEAPSNDEMIRRELGIAWTEGGGKPLNELINLPSLNIRGILSSSVGATARNVIPSTATASIDIRLVKGVDYRVSVERVLNHIRKQGYHVIESEPDDAMRQKHPKLIRVARQTGYNAARTSMDLEISRRIISAVERLRGPVAKLPTLGGSVPLYIFTDFLKMPAIGVPIVNHDNNQHSANENLRLQNLWDGIEVMAALMTMERK